MYLSFSTSETFSILENKSRNLNWLTVLQTRIMTGKLSMPINNKSKGGFHHVVGVSILGSISF